MNHRRKLTQLVKTAALQSQKNGRVEPNVVRKFASAFAKLPRAQALFCLSEYHKTLQRQVELTTLKIESAATLSPSQVNSIKRHLAAGHQILNVEVTKNSSLLGGVRVKIGDDVFEDTVQSRIEQLKGAIAG